MKLRFVSASVAKAGEIADLLEPHSIEIVPVRERIPELQSPDLSAIIEDKCLKAFARVGRPLIVEHTALYLELLNDFPGGLGQLFWDKLEADRFCTLFAQAHNPLRVRAVSALSYCDGRRLHHFEGEIVGTVARAPAGPRTFGWDCVFVPQGETQTLAEMGLRKHEISMRHQAIDAFVAHIKRETR